MTRRAMTTRPGSGAPKLTRRRAIQSAAVAAGALAIGPTVLSGQDAQAAEVEAAVPAVTSGSAAVTGAANPRWQRPQ